MEDSSSAGASNSESSLVTPPSAEYSNLASRLKPEEPEELRRKPKALVDCYRVLTKVFGHTGYKGKQKEIIEAAKLGADVLVIAPTGMGKSLCFQVPAVADEHGITIVISPLLALMKNQVSKLREHDIPAVAFTSETSTTEKQQIVRDLRSGHPTYRLLYITPEKLCSKDFVEMLEMVYSHKELNRLVIDEAHCISEWGHDFRTEYRRLGTFRDRFPDVPIMALTASATAHVQDDIVTSLKMSKLHMFKVVHPFNRSNLFYEVRYLQNPNSASQMANIHEYITSLHTRRSRASSGIVYCRTRATCNELAAYLRGKGLSARPYHRGIKPATLDKTLEEWQTGGAGNGGVDLVVATIAFGCGIDKSDVRYVIHYDLPKSLEGFYQETGRAGRDGSPSKCILYYSREDAIKVRKLVGMSHKNRQVKAALNAAPAPTQRAVDSLGALIEFAETTSMCRHVSICRYFGEPIDGTDANVVEQYCQKMCDICKYPEKAKRRKSALSSEEFVNTQLPRLEREAEPEDEDGYPSIRQHKLPQGRDLESEGALWPGNLWKGGNNEDSPVPAWRPESGSSGSTKVSLELKRSRQPINDTGNAPKRTRLKPPILGAGLVSSHLKRTFTAPFKTPFKVPLNDTQSTSKNCTVDTRSTVVEKEILPNDEVEDFSVVIDDEAEMVAIAQLGTIRSSSPIEIPDGNMEVDASFSQKVPTALREEAMVSIRKALQKVFVRSDSRDGVWKRLHMDPSDEETRLQILRATARALEFDVHKFCSTVEGYQIRALAQVSAVKALKTDKVWKEDDDDEDDELEDAREVISVLRGISTAARKGK